MSIKYFIILSLLMINSSFSIPPSFNPQELERCKVMMDHFNASFAYDSPSSFEPQERKHKTRAVMNEMDEDAPIQEESKYMLDLQDDMQDITRLNLSTEGASNPEGDQQRALQQQKEEETKSNGIEDHITKLLGNPKVNEMAKKVGKNIGLDVSGLLGGK